MASIDLYTKQQIDAKIPDTTGVTSGYVLTFNGSSTVWAAGSGGSDPSVADLIASVKGRIVNAWSGVDPTPSVKYINDSGSQTYGSSASMTVLGKSVTVTSSSTASIGTLGTHDVYKQTFSMSYGGNSYSFDMLIFYQSD